jgi:hypothetical protein
MFKSSRLPVVLLWTFALPALAEDAQVVKAELV